jgi:hypothetical protein
MELCSQFHALAYLTPDKKHFIMYGIGGRMVPRASQNIWKKNLLVLSRNWMTIPQSYRLHHYNSYITMHCKLIEHQHYGTVIRGCCNIKNRCTA